MVVAYDMNGSPVRARRLNCIGAMTLLLKDAISPNLVQTLGGQPVFVHGFPFANIAHGNSSLLATGYALKLADVVVTESGFATELGAEKFFDIVCRQGDLVPDCAVIVVTIRALKLHGGASLGDAPERGEPDLETLEAGLPNLDRHIGNIHRFGVPTIVAINSFPTDSIEETARVMERCEDLGIPCAQSTVFAGGGDGGRELAGEVLKVLGSEKVEFRFLYDFDTPIQDKIWKIATEMYSADGVEYMGTARRDIEAIEMAGGGGLPICVAKTQMPQSDDPQLLGHLEAGS